MTHDEVVDMKDFNEWWDSDIIRSSPFRRGSPKYWAWAAWQAALREQAMIEVQRLGQEIEDFNEIEKLSNLGKQILREIKPQRTWTTLTDEEFLKACQLAEDGNYLVAFQRIQQWLKEKNK